MEIREGHNKFYINDEQGKQIAEIVFVPTGENLAIIEHTDVDESLKGQGIGKQLVATYAIARMLTYRSVEIDIDLFAGITAITLVQ